MLTTLEQGVEGGKWFRLFDKVFSERNLTVAQVIKELTSAGIKKRNAKKKATEETKPAEEGK